MIDRYEEFKEWLKKQPRLIEIIDSVEYDGFTTNYDINAIDIFEAFEKEQEEKQREKEVKKILRRHIPTTPFSLHFGMNCNLMRDEEINKCYNELKEEGFLK